MEPTTSIRQQDGTDDVVASPYFADYDSATWRQGIAAMTEHSMQEITRLATEMAAEAKAYNATKIAHRDVIMNRPTDANIDGIRKFDQSAANHRRMVLLYNVIDSRMKDVRESMESIFGRIGDYALQLAVSDFTDTVLGGHEDPPAPLPCTGTGRNMRLTFDTLIEGYGFEIQMLSIPGWSCDIGNGWIIEGGFNGLRVERTDLIDAIGWPHVTFWQAHSPNVAFIFGTVLQPTKCESGPVTNQIAFISGCCVTISKKDIVATHSYLASVARF